MKHLKISRLVLLVVVLLGGFWLFTKLPGLPSLRNIFAEQQVVIDQTPIIIKSIKSIAQLVTVTAYDEVVVDSIVFNRTAVFLDAFRTVSPMAMLPSLQKQLVIIAKGKVMAGTDLRQLDSSKIKISGDTLSIQLPPAQILDAIVNPSDFETFEERGEWSFDEVTAVKVKARQKLIDRALQQQILTRANNKAKVVFQNFFHGAGYQVVIVHIQ